MNKKKIVASIMLLLSAFMWGISYSMQSIMSNSLKPYTIIFFKSFSGFILIAFCLITKRDFDTRTVLSGMLIGVVNGMGLIFQQKGLETSSVSNVSFISGLYIVFVPLLLLFTKKKPKKIYWLALLIACVGMYLLTMSGGISTICIGDIYTLISAFMFAIQIVLIGKYTQGSDFVVFCGFQELVASVMAGTLMFVFERPQLSDLNGLLFPILYVVFASGMAAQLLQNRYQKDIDSSLASLIMSLESVFGVLGGMVLLNQVLSVREIAGCVLIFIAILIAE